jgi:hypothetical protein
MRIQGRVLRPSNLAERRVLKTLAVDFLRVRRGVNPYVIARHIQKLAAGRGGDLASLRMLAKSGERPAAPVPALPDSSPAPAADERAA